MGSSGPYDTGMDDPSPLETDDPAELWRRGGPWWKVTAGVAAGILLVMSWPWQPAHDPGATWLRVGARPWLAVLGQGLLFVPFGACEALLVRRILSWWSLAVLGIALDAALLALVGESIQHWLPERPSSLVDLVASVAGAVAGALAADAWAGSPSGGEPPAPGAGSGPPRA